MTYRVTFWDNKKNKKITETYIHGESYYTKALVEVKARRHVAEFTDLTKYDYCIKIKEIKI